MSPELKAELLAASARDAGQVLGRGYQGSVHLYRTTIGEIVIKKPHRGGLLQWLWRALLRRESDIYTRLDGIPGIPRSLGLIDDCLVLEHVAGPSLREHENRIGDRDALFARLRTTLDAMHAAGVAHGDLKRKDNIIVTVDEEPYLVDFGIAVRRSARSRLWNQLVFEPLRQLDLNAWIKLKYGRRVDHVADSELLSATDASTYRPLWAERIARAVRVPWQTLTLRRPRQRWRARRKSK